jgi:2-polyprenyl-6-methoxyphenol hydroxylase-like FAD-dependent oxidoreductase
VAEIDILIAGAGPAGCATALSLAAFAPELRYAIADIPDACSKVGETVPPLIEPLLRHLGLWSEFLATGHLPSYRLLSAWGGPALQTEEFLAHAWQRGWRLDRVRFDRMLLDAAAARGAAHLRARVKTVAPDGETWRVRLSDGTNCLARFLVDATGGAAALARQCRPVSVEFDRLVGCVMFAEATGSSFEDPLVESFSEGWWYTAGLPGRGRVVMCMTDADRVRPLRLNLPEGFSRLLAATTHARGVVSTDALRGEVSTFPASSRHVETADGLPMLSVGDAGLRYDPLSGQGIAKALRSGIYASYAIADWLLRKDRSGLRRYRTMVRQQFADYRETWATHYARERRWASHPFWRRRAAPAAEPGARRLASG